MILISWPEPHVWNVNTNWHRFFFSLFTLILFLNFIIKYWIYWRLNIFVFIYLFFMRITRSHDLSHKFVMLSYNSLMLLHHFILMEKFVFVILIVFPSILIYFLEYFFQSHHSTVDWLKIKFYIFFLYSDPGLMAMEWQPKLWSVFFSNLFFYTNFFQLYNSTLSLLNIQLILLCFIQGQSCFTTCVANFQYNSEWLETLFYFLCQTWPLFFLIVFLSFFEIDFIFWFLSLNNRLLRIEFYNFFLCGYFSLVT